jgi:beta-galactosidase
MVPADWKGKRLILHFEAAAGEVQVLVNGKSVGRHFGIFLPFEFDITDAVNCGGSNEILVGVRKASLFVMCVRFILWSPSGTWPVWNR